jgi:tRNA(adenine34) deaminase
MSRSPASVQEVVTESPHRSQARPSIPGIFTMSDHERYMRRAIELARQAAPYPFGALIVDPARDRVLAEGWNRSLENPIWHGEIDAINTCARLHAPRDWTGLTLYTSAEPCPMCQAAIAWAGVGTVVYGSSIPFLAAHGWWQIDLRAEELIRRTPFRQCQLIGGVLEVECNVLYESTPWVPPAG